SHALEQASKVVVPLTSASTITIEESSALPSIGTQPLSAITPPELIYNGAPALPPGAAEQSSSDTDSFNLQPTSNITPVSKIHSQRRLSRRAVLFGLAGVAIGSAASNGIWIAKSVGLFPSPPLTLPLAGTTLLTYAGHRGSVYSAEWSPDGYRIAS